jgi:hypothetical protein
MATERHARNQIRLYPLRFEPIYQYRLWGGRRLGNLLTAPLPGDGPIIGAQALNFLILVWWLKRFRKSEPAGLKVERKRGALFPPTIGKGAGRYRQAYAILTQLMKTWFIRRFGE